MTCISNSIPSIFLVYIFSFLRNQTGLLQDLSRILMDLAKGKWKQNMIFKAWERCRLTSRPHLKLKSLSENDDDDHHEKKKKKNSQIAPHGCFSVHVGPERKRFVVKTKYVNHPLFQMLLEEAEHEYGFESDGPIWLPCNVDLFYKVLAEMDGEENHNNNNNIIFHGSRRSFTTMAKVFPFFVLRSPSRLLCHMNKGHGSCSVMDSELLRINRFH
ncbi:hypothetical protein GLYMA_06G167500v4 [Glycine max]|uniref:uncharacterized protein isoform X1 n=2 Tax=Glycine max TaxID=3847 RepID=UPI0002965140|nr:uncharacterized protein LOC100793967 isoform X1 [Glycine max]KAG4389857.1 hypothetical protein GLYMA_06G167500v4 [Glycine max]KAH1126307.1 hypothetical protein GYH30_015343 [Glycine max]